MALSETLWFSDPWLTGFFLTKQAEGCGHDTLLDYRRAFRHLQKWGTDNGKADLPALTTNDLRLFLAHVRTLPGRKAKTQAPKSVYNVWVALRSFFSWLAAETGKPNPMLPIPAPKSGETTIAPLSRDEVTRILKACDSTRPASTERRATYTMKRETAHRDRAIVMALLDTGLRASELCNLKLADVELATGCVAVRQCKGRKDRLVYLGKVGRKTLWRYLSTRADARPDDPLFVTRENHGLDRDWLLKLFENLGERASVPDLHPHRLRHTFATEFLRNGGNLLGLPRLLGHTSLDMVRRYAEIVEADLAKAHETGSPADRWHL